MGLPDGITALLFDLDGVLTDTASVHFAAWKDTFDPVLAEHGQRPFSQQDYDSYVDGEPRVDGVRSLLKSRDISLPDGPLDATSADSVNGIANRKNDRVLERIRTGGVKVYPGSMRYLQQAAKKGLRRAVVSSSANAAAALDAVGMSALIEARVDGNTLASEHLAGKPAPDSFLAGAKRLQTEPSAAAVFEDAVAGVEAGHRGGFGFVVGVNRIDADHARDLATHGANVVVNDLAELL
jgi:beta-phosphoglucomutase family hydrolase